MGDDDGVFLNLNVVDNEAAGKSFPFKFKLQGDLLGCGFDEYLYWLGKRDVFGIFKQKAYPQEVGDPFFIRGDGVSNWRFLSFPPVWADRWISGKRCLLFPPG